MTQLVVRKESGELLFDTSKITHGLLKSGYLAVNRTDGYYVIRGVNVDPDQKSSYNYYTGKYVLHGFTVQSSTCPIVFLMGPGCLVGTSRSGDSITFYYSGASPSTKYYCFDLMRDTAGFGPYLKTWLDSGVCTFNSYMPPLNVVAAITAPGPGPLSSNGLYQAPYVGGVVYQITSSSGAINSNGGAAPNKGCVVDIPIGGGEFAAHLPWTRSLRIIDVGPFGGGVYSYGQVEGAYGRSGGISFMFSATGEGIVGSYTGSAQPPATYTNLPVDRFPTALIIRTDNYPFPFN